MTYGRSNLRLKFKKNIALPLYLSSTKDFEVIEAVIAFYEANIGKAFGDINWDELRIIVGDDKLYEGLRKVMSYYYAPKETKLKPIVNPKNFRLKVFLFVNEKFGGYVPSKIREKAINELERILNIKRLDNILWINDLSEKPLIRIRKPSVKDVAKTYNFETLDTICVNSSKLILKVDSEAPLQTSIAKFIGKYSKIYGLIYTVKVRNRILEAEIEGPRSLFGRPTKYGSRLSMFLTKILSYLMKSEKWTIYSRTHFTRTILTMKLLSNSYMPELTIPMNVRIQKAFDSSIEERIYRTLKSIGFNVLREPEPIALENLLYIPDFKIEYQGKSFYIEVAGYWRKEYAEKKAYKLSEISKFKTNLIVIADENLKEYFKGLKTPIIYYTIREGKPLLPYGKLMEILKKY